MEFQVPEPGAWLRWLLDRKREPVTITENPQALEIEVDENGVKKWVDLTPDHLVSKNYMQIASRYKTLGLKPPPGNLYLGNTITRPSPEDPKADTKEPIRFVIDTQLTVPAGYVATNWTATVQAWHNGAFRNATGSVSLAVGSGEQQSVEGTGSFFHQLEGGVC
jgi:hypothetical protein